MRFYQSQESASHRIHEYQLLNEVIPRVNQFKYLGVTITSDLRWNKHCQTIRDKASRTLGLLRRTLPYMLKGSEGQGLYCTCSPPVRIWFRSMERPTTSLLSMGWSKYKKHLLAFVCCDLKECALQKKWLVPSLKWDCLHTRRVLITVHPILRNPEPTCRTSAFPPYFFTQQNSAQAIPLDVLTLCSPCSNH